MSAVGVGRPLSGGRPKMAHQVSWNWNCCGLGARWEELRVLMARYSPVCVCTQETLAGDAAPSGSPDYHVFFFFYPFPGQGHHGSTAVVVRRDVPFTSLNLSLLL